MTAPMRGATRSAARAGDLRVGEHRPDAQDLARAHGALLAPPPQAACLGTSPGLSGTCSTMASAPPRHSASNGHRHQGVPREVKPARALARQPRPFSTLKGAAKDISKAESSWLALSNKADSPHECPNNMGLLTKRGGYLVGQQQRSQLPGHVDD